MRENFIPSNRAESSQERPDFPELPFLVSYLEEFNPAFADPQSFETEINTHQGLREVSFIVRSGLDEYHYIYKESQAGSSIATLTLVICDADGRESEPKRLAYRTPDGWVKSEDL